MKPCAHCGMTDGHLVATCPGLSISVPEEGKVKRVPVDFDHSALNPGFIKGFARIAQYAAEKYGSALQYTNARLLGDKSPINHAKEHIDLYVQGVPHDRFGSSKFHLVAAGYNLMMEYFYFEKWGPLKHPLVVEDSQF